MIGHQLRRAAGAEFRDELVINEVLRFGANKLAILVVLGTFEMNFPW
jgi:hypothetical protein